MAPVTRLLSIPFSFHWLLALFLAALFLAPTAHARDPHLPRDIPSLTLYSRWDQAKTLSYMARHPRRPWKSSWRWKTLKLRLYTSSPRDWKQAHVHLVQRLSDWYFAPCRIRFRWTDPKPVSKRLLHRDGKLRYHMARKHLPDWKPGETLLFLTRRLRTPMRDLKGTVSLLGLNFRVLLKKKGRVRFRVPTVWVRSSLMFTTMPHELGHRLGLKHIRKKHNLMLTGSGVRSSFGVLWSSVTGYFDPVQFHFSRRQCRKMRRRWPRRKRQFQKKSH